MREMIPSNSDMNLRNPPDKAAVHAGCTLEEVFGDPTTLRGVVQYTIQLDRYLASQPREDASITVASMILEHGSSLMKAALSQFLPFFESKIPVQEFRRWILRLIEGEMNITTHINVLKFLQARPTLFPPREQLSLIARLGMAQEWGVRSFILFDQKRLEWLLTCLDSMNHDALTVFLQELVNDPRIPDFTTLLSIMLDSPLRSKIPRDVKKQIVRRAVNANTRQHQEAARRYERHILQFLRESMNDDDEMLEFLLSCDNDHLKLHAAPTFLVQRIVELFETVYQGHTDEKTVFSILDRWNEKGFFQKTRLFSRDEWKRHLERHLRQDHLEMLALLAVGLA